MHPLMLQQVIASCRNRIAQGDCPTTPTFPVEQLEEAVVELAAQQPPPLRNAEQIRAWLESDEGKAAVTEAVRLAKMASEELDESRRVTPEMLNTPLAAQQPEAPTLVADGEAYRLRKVLERRNLGWALTEMDATIIGEAVAKIESDAKRIRELEAENKFDNEAWARDQQRLREAESALAASREREQIDRYLATAPAEPVAQQPPPCPYGVHDCGRCAELREESAAQQPEAPPADELERWGIRYQGPREPHCVLMADGFWTPWHVAAARIRTLQASEHTRALEAVEADERIRTLEAALRAILAVSERHKNATMNTISDCARMALTKLTR